MPGSPARASLSLIVMPEIRGLYAITDPSLTPADRLLNACEAALRGGARLLQYRDKPASPPEREQRALRLRELCERYGALFIVNDDPLLAIRVGAHGVHLGKDDLSIAEARAALGREVIIGATCHGDIERAHAAVQAGADYVAFGRFYPSRTKPQAPPAEPGILSLPLPVPKVAIGGITLDNARPLINAGAAAVAVIHGLFGSDNIEDTARRFAALFQEA